MTVWRNWAHNVEIQPHRISSPHGFGEVVDIVNEARRLGRHVRAVGRGWSFTDIAATTDFLVDTRRIRGVLAMSRGRRVWGQRIHDPGPTDDPHREDDPLPAAGYPPDRSWVLVEALRDDVVASDRRFVHVLCGTTIRELYAALDDPASDLPVGGAGARDRWALPTMGGAAGQTVAGALATGTHGGDFELPPMADMVRAIHLIAADGTQRWIEPARAPLCDPARLQASFRGDVPREHLHVDDDMFDAALVSLGSFGIIYSLVLEVRAQFGLSEVVHAPTTWHAIREDVRSGAIFGDGLPDGRPRWLADHPAPARGTARPQCVGVFLNPYRTSGEYDSPDGDRHVTLVTHAAADADVGPRHVREGGIGGLELLHMIKDFESAGTPAATADVVDRVIALLRSPTGTRGYPVAWSVLDTTSNAPLPVLSLEIAVSTAGGMHVTLIDKMLAAFDRIMRDGWRRGVAIKFAGGINLRFTRPTHALLGMQYPLGLPGERFCHLEIIVVKEVDIFGNEHQGPSAMENYSEDFVRAFEQAAAHVGARLHWGQLSLANSHSPYRYPGRARWAQARDALTAGGAIRTFENAFTVGHGLLHLSPGWTAHGGLLPAPPPDDVVDANPASHVAPRALLNPITGCLEVVAVGADGQVCRSRESGPGGAWTAWEMLPQSARFEGRAISIYAEQYAYLYVFARARDGGVWQTNSFAGAGAWGNGAWGRFGGPTCIGGPAAIARNRLPYVFVTHTDGAVRFVTINHTFSAAGNFGDWELLPAWSGGRRPAGPPCVAANVDGRLEVLVRGDDGRIHRSNLVGADDHAWTAWDPMGVARFEGDPAIARGPDGRLHALCRGTGGGLWHAAQTAPGGGWGEWRREPAVTAILADGAPPDLLATGGALHAAVRDVTGHVHLLSLDGAASAWAHVELSADAFCTIADPALGVDGVGRLHAFSRAAHDIVTRRSQLAAGRW